jgi:hypothetical protein
LDTVLVELEQFGKTNDAGATERARRMLNITRDTGEFLAVLVKATMARRVLAIGTSNGYSTLWLASAARAIGGAVTTVELAQYKIALAATNFARAGLAACISLISRGRRPIAPALGCSRFRFNISRLGASAISRMVAGSAACAAPGRPAGRRQCNLAPRRHVDVCCYGACRS